MNHEQATELIAAHALDAVDGDEAAALDAHLAECPRCRSELAQHQQVAALLANGGADAPERVWDGIASRLGPPTAPPRILPDLKAPRHHRSAPTRQRRLMAVLAAAAAVAIAVLGVQVARLGQRVDRLGPAGQVQAAMGNPATHVVRLTGRGHRLAAKLVIPPSGRAYLVAAHMPALPDTETYQLWAIRGSTAVSLGLLGARPGTRPVVVTHADASAAFGITVEPAHGVVSPTAKPVALGQA